MAKASLAGFQRIVLDSGQSSRVTIRVDRRALSYWSTDKHDWVFAGGNRPIYVGSGSRDIRLKSTLPATIPGSI
jgi:beta-glucosidase